MPIVLKGRQLSTSFQIYIWNRADSKWIGMDGISHRVISFLDRETRSYNVRNVYFASRVDASTKSSARIQDSGSQWVPSGQKKRGNRYPIGTFDSRPQESMHRAPLNLPKSCFFFSFSILSSNDNLIQHRMFRYYCAFVCGFY